MRPVANLDSHYDVEINPVVHVQNQKKPKAMLRAVWEQTCLDVQSGPFAAGFSACAYDGRKNCFTPIKFPLAKGKSSLAYIYYVDYYYEIKLT